jgi:hypothetical protein
MIVKYVYCVKCNKQLLALNYRDIPIKKILCKGCRDEQRK